MSLVLVFTMLVWLCPAGETQLQRYEFSEPHMGTTFRLVFYAPSKAVAEKAAKAAFARIAELDDIMSDYKPASELRRLCEKAGGAPVKVSPDLYKILARSQELSQQSDGAFDVTVAPVVKLWRRARRTRKLPDPQELREALARVGSDKMKLDPVRRTVQLLLMGMLLDLGGIAKGYAADAVLEVLRSFGITRALVAAGGDIAVGEAPPDNSGWKIAVGPLRDPTDRPKHHLFLKNAAVSTSGDVEQFVVIDGKRYSHIVNPRTGLGLVGRSSVSVVAPNCTASDSLATAISVLGPEKGFRLIKDRPGVAVLFVRENEQEQLVEIATKNFARFEASQDGR
jgi:thiamine biosynthesis lipoprotein